MRVLSALELQALECGLSWGEGDTNSDELVRIYDLLVELGLVAWTLRSEDGDLYDRWTRTERGEKELSLQRLVRR